MFNVKYLAMHNVQMHAGAISKLLYGFASIGRIIHSLKFVDYLPLQTHTPHNNLHLFRMVILILHDYCGHASLQELLCV